MCMPIFYLYIVTICAMPFYCSFFFLRALRLHVTECFTTRKLLLLSINLPVLRLLFVGRKLLHLFSFELLTVLFNFFNLRSTVVK